jgi:hypothetical protein
MERAGWLANMAMAPHITVYQAMEADENLARSFLPKEPGIGSFVFGMPPGGPFGGMEHKAPELTAAPDGYVSNASTPDGGHEIEGD